MFLASGLTRWGSVPAVLLFLRQPSRPEARIIYIEETVDAPAGELFAAAEALVATAADMRLARDGDALLTVQLTMPDALPRLAAHRTVLTLTFEPAGDATRLTLTHAGFGRGAAWDEALDWFTRGWAGVVPQLKAAVEDSRRSIRLAA